MTSETSCRSIEFDTPSAIGIMVILPSQWLFMTMMKLVATVIRSFPGRVAETSRPCPNSVSHGSILHAGFPQTSSINGALSKASRALANEGERPSCLAFGCKAFSSGCGTGVACSPISLKLGPFTFSDIFCKADCIDLFVTSVRNNLGSDGCQIAVVMLVSNPFAMNSCSFVRICSAIANLIRQLRRFRIAAIALRCCLSCMSITACFESITCRPAKRELPRKATSGY